MPKSGSRSVNDGWEALARKGFQIDIGPRQIDLIDARWADAGAVKMYRSFPSGMIEPSRYEFVERDVERTILAFEKVRGRGKTIRRETKIAVYDVRPR